MVFLTRFLGTIIAVTSLFASCNSASSRIQESSSSLYLKFEFLESAVTICVHYSVCAKTQVDHSGI
jgi:hypothetical protein